ncbi:MAG: hypothetical protein WBW84_10155, partial [Acidobacteriaceae bacterium]
NRSDRSLAKSEASSVMEVFPVPTPCRFTLDNGQPCGNHALRLSHFCRHHSSEALRRRGPKTRPLPPDDPAERAQRTLSWRRLHEWIPAAESEEALAEVSGDLMTALGDRRISHRSAGRLFEAIEDRRRLLEAQELAQSLLETADSIQASLLRSTGAPSQQLANDTLALRRSFLEWTTHSKQSN